MKIRWVFIGSIICLLNFVLALYLTIYAASSANVAATVLAQNVSVSITDGTVSYSTMSVGTSATTAESDGDSISDTQSAFNAGNVSENFNIAGTTSPDWGLASAPNTDTYSHDFCLTTCDTTPTWIPLAIGYTELATNIGTSATQAFDLRLRMPTTSSVYTIQQVNVTVQATSAN